MAMSIPVVATNVGGVPEVVRDGFGGFCVDHSDFTGFADKVVMLITDSRLSEQQGILGRERVRELFAAERMSVQYYELYSNILIQAGKSR
jgi:glycosyltransferase involved in cell wall biosynthesis